MDFVCCSSVAGGLGEIEQRLFATNTNGALIFSMFFAVVMVWTQQPSHFVANRKLNCAPL
jgi:hypothetical protein